MIINIKKPNISVKQKDDYRLRFSNSIAQFESNVYSVRLFLRDVDNSKIEFNCVFDILESNLFAGNSVRYETLKVLLQITIDRPYMQLLHIILLTNHIRI